jgi:hypothetical protein
VICPKCEGAVRCVDTRESWRRRECKECGHRFNTIEVLKEEYEEANSMISIPREMYDMLTGSYRQMKSRGWLNLGDKK